VPTNDTDLAFATIADVGWLFRNRKLSPVELTKILLARIERLQPKLNAYITVSEEIALRQAKKAEAELFAPRGRKARRDRGPLHGIPISLKDNIYTAGVRTTAGSQILRDFLPARDALVVTQLYNAGAVLLGKTNLHEFAYGVTTNNPYYGPARNPWDAARIPGGSSGGSAVALAAGLCYGSIGTDTGGSIRIPASLCGIAGLKSTLGSVSVEGILPLSRRLDCAGPLARTTEDVATLLDPILAGDGKSGSRLSSWRARAGKRRKFRLGRPREFFFDVLSDEVRTVFEAAARSMRKIGGEIREISIPLAGETQSAGNEIAWAEATHYHEQAGWFPARAAEYGQDVRERLAMGAKVPATVYMQALETREKFILQIHAAMSDAGVDALLVPSTPITAPLIGEEITRIAEKDEPTRALLLRLNRPANLAGIPAMSVPCGFTSAGLPVGLQLIGAAGDEFVLLDIAQRFERELPPKRQPSL
jgi:aspartyl-tRNA(Asn)/glutamyl-tRNA(Gln) amidotransferase subunit A